MSPMPYAVDNDFFRRKALEAGPQRESFRRELGLEAGRPVILFASKLRPASAASTWSKPSSASLLPPEPIPPHIC